MVWIFEEIPVSGAQTTGPDSAVLKYVCGRDGDSAYIRAYATSATPLIFDGLFRRSISTDPLGGGMWNVDVKYGPVEPPTPGSYRIRYDTTGGTAKITNAKEHIQSYPATATDHKGAINVQPDDRVEGTDVVIPSFRWTEEHTLSVLVADWIYARTILKALTGRTNNATFRGFPAGQVRFDGATGSNSNQNPKEVSLAFNFVQSDDVTGLTVGDVTGVDKGGWEYAWTEYQTEEDPISNDRASRPKAVHVERLLDPGDFSLLQIGS